jgi:hypothetical protein
MEFPTSDSDVIGACEGATGAQCSFVECDDILFFAPGLCTTCHSDDVYQYSYLWCKFRLKKTHPIYYMYIGPVIHVLLLGNSAERGEIPDFRKGKPTESS